MAAKKDEQSVPEGTPVQDGGTKDDDIGYKITCRNKITKRIGGVDFVDGIGRTADSYAASWFASKDGYIVELNQKEQL